MLDNTIMVSIICAAYNHEKYIADALSSFLMQKTNFKYEIIVNDDASTDSTKSIIEKFYRKYPNIIRPIYQEINQYSKGVDVTQLMVAYSRGKYIATCEGDDYWIDPYKLQKQVDYMEKNPNCSLCGHPNYVVSENKEILRIRSDCQPNSIVDLICNGGYMHFATRLAKREVYDLPKCLEKKFYQGVAFIYNAHLLGYLYYFGDPMSAWRINENSVTHSLYLYDDNRLDIYKDYIHFYDSFDNYTNGKYHEVLVLRKVEELQSLIRKNYKHIPKKFFRDIKKETYYKKLPFKYKMLVKFKSIF